MQLYEFSPDSPAPKRVMWGQPAGDLALARSLDRPFVYVFSRGELSTFRALDTLVVDRHRKHRARPLRLILLGQKKVPLVEGTYTSASQLRRSVRVLLREALEANERNVYLIGVADSLMDALDASSGVPEERPDAGRPDGPDQPMPNPGSPRPLGELLDDIVVPPELEKEFIGYSAEAALVRKLILRAAEIDQPILIMGANGTGKEIIARAIHRYSARRHQGIVTVNCGAIPYSLLESELFGHEAGAFTGSIGSKEGLWEHASGSTLFLDEIGDLQLDHQARILRALQEGTFRKVGGIKEVRSNARVIAATNRDLFSMVQRGQFRVDLYYRLRYFLIRTPALADHPDDIAPLAQTFWRRIAGTGSAPLSGPVIAALQGYSWPGNARELKAVLTNLFALFGLSDLGVEHVQAVFALDGRALDDTRPAADVEGLNLHRLECLRHLRQTDEVVQACREVLRALDSRASSPAVSKPDYRLSIAQLLRELDTLAARPILFTSDATYTAVCRLRNSMLDLSAFLDIDVQRAEYHARQDVSERLRAVQSALFHDVERVMGNGGQ